MQCCQIMREKQARQGYENKTKTSDFSGRDLKKKKKKKKVKKKRLLHLAYTYKYHPESRNVLRCLIGFLFVFICYDPFLF